MYIDTSGLREAAVGLAGPVNSHRGQQVGRRRETSIQMMKMVTSPTVRMNIVRITELTQSVQLHRKLGMSDGCLDIKQQ